ncbi:MAG: hypothetical protein AAF738_04540 [Bacteroidota bacterium]
MASKNYKNTARKEVPLPEDFSWENLNEGIFDKMDAEKKKKDKGLFLFSYFRGKRPLLLLFLLLSIGSITMYVCNGYQQTEQHAGKSPIQGMEQTAAHLSSKFDTLCESENAINTKRAITAVEQLGTINHQHTDDKTPINTASKKHPRTTSPFTKENEQEENDAKGSNTDMMEKVNIIEEVDSSALVQEQTQVEGAHITEEKSIPLENLERVTVVSPLVHSLSLLELPNSTIRPNFLAPSAPVKTSSETGAGFALEAVVGTAFWQTRHFKQLTTTSENINTSERGRPSTHLQLLLQLGIRRNMGITTGIEYQTLVSRFNYSAQTNSTERVNTIVGVEINTLQQETTPVYQDTSIAIVQTRQVQHYNTHRFVNIPLALHYHLPLQNPYIHTLRISAGGLFSIPVQMAQGRTWAENSILTYDNNNVIFNKTYGLAFHTSLEVRHILNQRWYCNAGIQYRRWLSNWSQTSSVEYKVSTVNVNLSVGHFF